MKKLKNIKEIKGITLIALIITIVILIILASVGITITLGNNGLFSRAKQAKEEFQTKTNEEINYTAKLEENINLITDGRGGDNTTYKILYEGTINKGETKTLNDDLTNYKRVAIIYKMKISTGEITYGYANVYYDYCFLQKDTMIDACYNCDSTSYYISKRFKFPTISTIYCEGSWTKGYTADVLMLGFKTY